jgi:hypothetical protein
MHNILCFYLHNFQESKKDKHNLITEKRFHWAILKIHKDTTCDLTHVDQKTFTKFFSLYLHYECF